MAGRSEQGEFTRARRGWRRRRRVSQLELAARAGTTQRHRSFIERGRSVPGRTMVVRLAEALEVPLRDRNVLLLAAGYAPAYRETRLDDPKPAPVRTALAPILDGHLPDPAVVVDRHGDLVAANDAFWGLTDRGGGAAARAAGQPAPPAAAPPTIGSRRWSPSSRN